ncbi:S-adenosyl-L-methionine-dependent methyltransferase [Aspergillus ibericus CBS 121593]|uniref:S-adenosyl-L-methionine-dependent methyltransferase n=1 Tax=Aspergillus ibericus CBS 121593 TaxID=1448316 RepID=A0A395GWN9_9EURO|nr:S-adenosyl-L-methionine-dependent methyltransferase [Aspergillus ibericus CBS 121593]RAK99956.1 S-adenosyl-L-methionine-dependent methyltransferase [Aspergillus ibericus CBS 121593]
MISHTSKMTELAARISENTAKVDAYLRSRGLPFPSFHEDGPVDFGIDDEEIQQAQEEAIYSSLELQRLLQGPKQFYRPLPNIISLQAISKYEIATKVPIHGQISFADLAQQCGLSEVNVRRFLRYAMFFHKVFCEPRQGYVAHTAASRFLAENKVIQDVLSHYAEEAGPSYALTLRALDEFNGQEEPNQTGWNLYHQTTDSPWEYYDTHPEQARRFFSTMAYETELQDRSNTVLVNSYPWSSLRPNGTQATVVDLGGSRGVTATALAQSVPNLKVIVQDIPSMIKGAKEGIPSEVGNRVDFVAHDFFKTQPLHADAYIIRHVFHNWSDTNVIRILQALVPALHRGSRIIINDYIAPPPGVTTPLKEQRLREMDMTMLTLCNAYERESQDWKNVIERADSRFQIAQMLVPNDSEGIIEIVWEG